MAKKSEEKENYLYMPDHIRNIPELGFGDKELLAHIYSFGRNGCWQKNETLGKMFFRSTRTISDWVTKLKKGRHILWKSGKGYYRTFYAKTHPDVKSAQTLIYRGREIAKSEVVSGQAKSTQVSRKLPSELEGNCEATSQKAVIPVSRKLPHTNNTTIKETTKNTATPMPLPAGGQAPALLKERKAQDQANIGRKMRNFGKPDKAQKLTSEEFENNRRKQINALLGSENG